ncbi:MAG: ribosome maturation factor RimP [Elusimicrobia bacterium]|nr:ribosome maturation factor RimP [Elusimicrobiota bacterium]
MNAAEIEKLVEPLVGQESAELVHLTFAKEGPKWVLRVFLDKEGGISLDDCAYFSDRIGSLLDTTDAMNRSYVLEVSSPGLDRIIKKEKDFARFSGKTVRLRLKVPEAGQRNFKGVLRGYRDGKVLVECEGLGGKEPPREFAHSLIEEVRIDSATEVEKEL